MRAGAEEGEDASTAALLALPLLPSPVACVVRSGAGPARDAWLAALRTLVPAHAPWRRMPAGITPDRLLGGIDLAATLAKGSPSFRKGLLAESDGGWIVVPMAERLAPDAVGALLEALDTGRIRVEREGRSAIDSASVRLILLDESEEGEEGLAAALVDRAALHLTLPPRWTAPREFPGALEAGETRGPRGGAEQGPDGGAESVPEAVERSTGGAAGSALHVPDDAIRAIAETSLALGIASMRPGIDTLAIARALSAATGEEDSIPEAALEMAARLSLAPRARSVPPPPAAEAEAPVPPPPAPPSDPAAPDPEPPRDAAESGALADRIVEAVRPALPHGLLDTLAMGRTPGRPVRAGRRGEELRAPSHGRTIGARRGDPRRGGLHLGATLSAAAPWQRVRAREDGDRPGSGLRLRGDDLHVRVRVRRIPTTTVFLVDASGSQAMHRLGDAKGAVEILLAEGYARREQVALIVFRGQEAGLVLPPTRALARARRTLAGIPGGGGTPMASALLEGLRVAAGIRRDGSDVRLVLLSDGRANVSLDGSGGRPKAEEDALRAARRIRAEAIPFLLIDSSLRGTPFATQLAHAAGGRCLPLPRADSRGIAGLVHATRPEAAA